MGESTDFVRSIDLFQVVEPSTGSRFEIVFQIAATFGTEPLGQSWNSFGRMSETEPIDLDEQTLIESVAPRRGIARDGLSILWLLYPSQTTGDGLNHLHALAVVCVTQPVQLGMQVNELWVVT